MCDLTDWGEEDCCCCGTKGQWLLCFVILCSLGKTSGGSGYPDPPEKILNKIGYFVQNFMLITNFTSNIKFSVVLGLKLGKK